MLHVPSMEGLGNFSEALMVAQHTANEPLWRNSELCGETAKLHKSGQRFGFTDWLPGAARRREAPTTDWCSLRIRSVECIQPLPEQPSEVHWRWRTKPSWQPAWPTLTETDDDTALHTTATWRCHMEHGASRSRRKRTRAAFEGRSVWRQL